MQVFFFVLGMVVHLSAMELKLTYDAKESETNWAATYIDEAGNVYIALLFKEFLNDDSFDADINDLGKEFAAQSNALSSNDEKKSFKSLFGDTLRLKKVEAVGIEEKGLKSTVFRDSLYQDVSSSTMRNDTLGEIGFIFDAIQQPVDQQPPNKNPEKNRYIVGYDKKAQNKTFRKIVPYVSLEQKQKHQEEWRKEEAKSGSLQKKILNQKH